ncbi:ABC transporter substrate-binding protein [Halocatena salina]|uniref:ABC transporter substrate-binding protein n=1 Tax=Halocatena salina TaxID=2934340 RepID=A0A8U0A740_9EURY|nr:ABC transporter substrate-binding protein [Halocatena salina]UPM44338.1 ABC transporter substrate-binding protein [Halocatena salina]
MRDGDSIARNEEIRKLDGILPENIDRRKFLLGTAATVGGLAGCLGGSPAATKTDDLSKDAIERDVTWRTPWKPNLSYSDAYIAKSKGQWIDANVKPPSVKQGNGSGDTAKRVANRKDVLGHGSITPQISGLAQGYDLKLYGTAKARIQHGLLYRTDVMNSPTDLANKRIIVVSGLAEQTWNIYANNVDPPSSVTVEYVDDSTAAAMLSEGRADGVWRGIYQVPSVRKLLPKNAKLGVEPLYNRIPSYGFTLIANGSWLEESNNLEYTTRVLEGYSSALKWIFLNPEETVTIMRNDVNQSLQLEDKENQLKTLKAGVIATNLSSPTKKNGLGYLDKDVLRNSFETLGQILDIDETPSVEAAADFRPRDNAELASFTADEWKQMEENAEPFSSMYKS